MLIIAAVLCCNCESGFTPEEYGEFLKVYNPRVDSPMPADWAWYKQNMPNFTFRKAAEDMRKTYPRPMRTR